MKERREKINQMYSRGKKITYQISEKGNKRGGE